MKIYDFDGNETDWAWLHSTFGPEVRVDGRDGTRPGFDVAELRAAHGHSALVAVVESTKGEKLPGVKVARWWEDNTLEELPRELQTWNMIGVWGKTKENGDIGFGMGDGDQYDWEAGQYAVSEIWVEGNSARVHGLGWPLGHSYHIEPTFRFSGDPGPPPPVNGDEIDEAIGYLQLVIVNAQKAIQILEAM